MKRRVAVTGSEGFVGRHVVARLRAEPDVEVIRVVKPGTRGPKTGDIPVVEIDVLDPRAGASSLPRDVDVLIHAAWAGLNDFRSDAHLRQVDAHERFVREWLERGVRRVLGVGTCLEYGLVEGELTESMPTHPVIAYAEAKAELSRRLEEFAVRFGATWSWARIFYPYGDGQHPRSLWTSLNAAIDRGDESFPMSGGEQVRDYLPVSTVGSDLALLALAEAPSAAVNICSGRPVVLRDLVARWLEARGASIRVELGVYPYPDYEPMSFWGSRSRLDDILAPRTHPHGGRARL